MTTSRPTNVTVFGAAGFVGRYVVQALARSGARIRAVTRDPQNAAFLKPLGGLGQLAIVRGDLQNDSSVEAVCAEADAVVNLVGVFAGQGQDVDAIHVDGAKRAAEAARDAGARAFVQMSALGADPKAQSDYARSKGEGETAVREAMPVSTIFRPSTVFGPEDEFLNRFANLIRLSPLMPVVGGETKFQPVYVADLAEAVASAALDPVEHGGKTYEIGGPDVISMRELLVWIARTIGKDESFIDVPNGLTERLTKSFGWLPGAPLTYDQFLMLQKDNVLAGENGLSAFGISPTPMQAVAPNWLVRYRKQGRFTKVA